jgi:hypothetical protein
MTDNENSRIRHDVLIKGSPSDRRQLKEVKANKIQESKSIYRDDKQGD